MPTVWELIQFLQPRAICSCKCTADIVYLQQPATMTADSPPQMHGQLQSQPITPSHTPMPSRSNQMLSADFLGFQLFQGAIRHPRTVPANPRSNPVTSMHLDNIAHAMWSLAFENEPWMAQTTMHSTTLPWPLLKTLARLNYLPSWWFLRELAKRQVRNQGWCMDDRVMEATWAEAAVWCQSQLRPAPNSQAARDIPRRNSMATGVVEPNYGVIEKLDNY